MPALGFVLPLLPGKTEADRAALAACWTGDRQAGFAESRRRHGITRETVWIQSTPGGDVAVICIEAEDLGAAVGGLATSDHPFDRWFREHVRDVHGIALEDGFAPPQLELDFQG